MCTATVVEMPPPPSAPAASLSSSTSTLVLSGKTRAFLSKAEKAGGGSNAPLEVIDAESGEVVKLNAVAAVGGLPARAPQDRQQLTIPASVVAGCTDRASLAAAIQSYQHSQLAQLVASEAARESVGDSLRLDVHHGADAPRHALE